MLKSAHQSDEPYAHGYGSAAGGVETASEVGVAGPTAEDTQAGTPETAPATPNGPAPGPRPRAASDDEYDFVRASEAPNEAVFTTMRGEAPPRGHTVGGGDARRKGVFISPLDRERLDAMVRTSVGAPATTHTSLPFPSPPFPSPPPPLPFPSPPPKPSSVEMRRVRRPGELRRLQCLEQRPGAVPP